ncbi:grasp-with-spasm system ATP-grasp peptide maturase [Chryseobacterium sp. MEBOG06]|uniref:grasp-with-spasm system ATP-grasp peptide maturase n=1 Tax=Chryseobacterium sp. MEBOG06 TaxID=2879938 RepID=UPI001F2897F7|nr:grasp-with-spasm system ATP-grasp peptide maturase [Chryseobacterium sp. MEBOG06]UKB84599.1 grasp-with-spasm system ATP-grasp peptide maturase [Chryseobacterium sp. MEBOG06]
MILILSRNRETTTDEVIKWLSAMKKKFIRIHEDELFEIKIKDKRICIESYRNSFFIDDISSIWYRRGGLKFKRLHYRNSSIDLYMHEHQNWLEDYVIKTLESKKHINTQSNRNINKLLVLEKAKEQGLSVPIYFLAENTDDVVIGKTITKSITGTAGVESFESSQLLMYTAAIKKKEDSQFFISFFQEKIEKDYEIRSFYLNGKIWSIAIISQNDEQTKLDFRKYNNKRPNRNVRYNLPKDIDEKIHLLMQSLNLNCGSIDFIKKGNEYYFLEINPIGQFLGISLVCNYSLEKEIADYL